jgi:hypothetical protein
MRLTLRTMLAYQDEILDPNDAEELGRKIDANESASSLMKRMRTVLKKVRMNAPKLDGKGMGSDANTVAEYLDSALPQDRVGDFERICLDSDAHLAEVAGCHQILALVLRKPAEVPEALRERVYAIGLEEKATQAPLATKKATAAAAAAAAANGHAEAARPAPEVPEYLRSGRQGGFWQLVGTVAIAFLVVALLLRMMGPFNSSHPVLALVNGSPPADNTALPNDTTPGDDNAPEPSPAPEPSQDPTASDPVDSASNERPAVDPVEPPPSVPPAPVDPVEGVPPVPPADIAATDVPERPVDPVPAPAPMPMPPVDPVVPPAVPDVPEADIVMDAGRFISDEQVLAIQPKNDGIWQRVPARAMLGTGQQLVALPAFRPQIALASGVQVTLAGETSLHLLPPGEDGASRMSVDFGRLVIVTAGAAGAQIDLDLAGLKGVATLVDADSALAVSVKQFLPPGSDPETTPVIPVVELFNTRGRVAWDEAGHERVNIPANHVRIYAGIDPAETVGPYAAPDWIDAKGLSGIDRQSAAELERMLDVEKPLNLTLAEALGYRQVNVRSLAARCLSFLGDFEPLVKELNDPRQYSFWNGGFGVLRHAMQRGPESAAALRATLERLRPDQAAELYRLLWGYSPDQLAKGSDLELVEFLKSEHMDVRVLAFQNLAAITGAYEFYMPQKKPEDLKSAIQNWKARQAKGTITYRLPPAAIEPYKPLDKPPAGAVDLPAPRGAVAPLVPLE